MKKAFLILLAITLLLMPACSNQDQPTQSQIIDPDLVEWNHMYWVSQLGGTHSITHRQDDPNGETKTVKYDYDGEKFTVSDDKGTRTYPYLVLDEVMEKTAEGYQQHFYLILSEDAEMTYQRYLQYSAQPPIFSGVTFPASELVFDHILSLDSAETFGKIPLHMEEFLSTLTDKRLAHCGKDSYFTGFIQDVPYIDPTGAPYPKVPIYQLCRYSYDGTRLGTVSFSDGLSEVTELADGGFVVVTSKNYLLCYSAEGTVRWEYQLDARYVSHLFQVGSRIYCMGKKKMVHRSDDLYFCVFSGQGALLAENTVGGSDFEWLTHVIPTENGFALYGATQSRDGDLPFSTDGYGVDFQAHLSLDLKLTDATALPDGDYFLTQVGFHDGKAIYDNDPILLPRTEDRLPADTYVKGIYSWEDGYVILRVYRQAPYPFTNLAQSYMPCYQQLIATCYDAGGNVLWQTVTDPYVE